MKLVAHARRDAENFLSAGRWHENASIATLSVILTRTRSTARATQAPSRAQIR